VFLLFLSQALDKQSGYYSAFPAESMNVVCKLKEIKDASAVMTQRRTLYASQDFDVGELIYKVRLTQFAMLVVF
jgi:hypothetical protein